MLSPAQALARVGKLGSSEAPAALGVDPYKSPADLFLEKTGAVPAFAGNAATARGQFLEPALLAYAASMIGVPITPSVMYIDGGGLLAANLDAEGVIDGEEFSVEAKTTGLAKEWGVAGEGEDDSAVIPPRVVIQVHHGFAVKPTLRRAFIPVLLADFGALDLRLYRVERNEELVAAVRSGGERFMRENVMAGVMPTGDGPSLDVLKRIRREPGKVVAVGDDLLDDWIVAKAAEKQAKEGAEAAQARLLAALGDAEGGEGSRAVVTYMQSQRKGYTVAPSTVRTLRVKNKKESGNVDGD